MRIHEIHLFEQQIQTDVFVVVNFYFQTNFFVYSNVHKNKGKLKFTWKKN